jgi:phospholipase C
MRKWLFAGIVSLFAASIAAQTPDLSILTKVEQSDHKWIKPCITILNNNKNLDVTLGGKTVNYYFYAINLDIASLQYQWFNCPVAGTTIKVFPFTPEYTDGPKKANFYCQMKFPANAKVPKNSSLEFKYGFHTPDYRIFYEDDDWSYSVTANYKENKNVVIFDGTTRYWGNLPGGGSGGIVIQNVWADPNPVVTGTTTMLKATATGGTGTLIYTWDPVTTTPPSPPVTFGPQNGSSLGNQTLATFAKSGTYQFTVTVLDKGSNASVKSSPISVTVNQEAASIEVWPREITTSPNVQRKFTSTLRDQFGFLLAAPQPAAQWEISGTGGTLIVPTSRRFAMVQTSPNPGTTASVTAKYNSFTASASLTVATPAAPQGKLLSDMIQHVFIIMQENRTFDNYFGTYPGSDGFARIDFTPVHHHITDVPTLNPKNGKIEPKSPENDYPHFNQDAVAELSTKNYEPDGTYLKTDAFSVRAGIADLKNFDNDCFGYHNGDVGDVAANTSDLCNYWAIADSFVLQDAMFESCKSFSQPSHNYMVSGWSAGCDPKVTNKCVLITDLGNPTFNGLYPWHSIAYLLPAIDWSYYQCTNYNRVNCTSCDANCFNGPVDNTNSFWLPMSKFTGISEKEVKELFDNLSKPENIPKVNWIAAPGSWVSEHPLGTWDVRYGQAYVTTIIKAIMNSPVWDHCAIFVSWDDWGGHYDHAIPPYVVPDPNNNGENHPTEGWGIRVPGLMLSPYAKKATGAKTGWVDHEQYSHDAYLKLIEDLYINSQPIPNDDNRPVQREKIPELGNLLNEFDFNQPPRLDKQPFINNLKCKNYTLDSY